MSINHKFRDDRKIVLTLYCDVTGCLRREIIVHDSHVLNIELTEWKTLTFRDDENEIIEQSHVCPIHEEKPSSG